MSLHFFEPIGSVFTHGRLSSLKVGHQPHIGRPENDEILKGRKIPYPIESIVGV